MDYLKLAIEELEKRSPVSAGMAKMQLQEITTCLQEAEAVIKSGQVLVLKMFEVYDDPQYQAAFSLLYDHQGKYSGKTWTKEQDDFTARAAAWLKGGTN